MEYTDSLETISQQFIKRPNAKLYEHVGMSIALAKGLIPMPYRVNQIQIMGFIRSDVSHMN